MHPAARYGRTLWGRVAGRVAAPATQPTAQQRLHQSVGIAAGAAAFDAAGLDLRKVAAEDAEAATVVAAQDETVVRARRHLASGAIAEAAALLRGLPRDSACWVRDAARLAADVCTRRGEVADAERILREVLARPAHPRDADPAASNALNHQALGALLFHQERYREAAVVLAQSADAVVAALGRGAVESAEALVVRAATLAHLKQHHDVVACTATLRDLLDSATHHTPARAPLRVAALRLATAADFAVGDTAGGVVSAAELLLAVAERDVDAGVDVGMSVEAKDISRVSTGTFPLPCTPGHAPLYTLADASFELAAGLLLRRDYEGVRTAVAAGGGDRRDLAWLCRAVDAATHGGQVFTDAQMRDHITAAGVFQRSREVYEQLYLDLDADASAPASTTADRGTAQRALEALAQRIVASGVPATAARATSGTPSNSGLGVGVEEPVDEVDESDDCESDDVDAAATTVSYTPSAATPSAAAGRFPAGCDGGNTASTSTPPRATDGVVEDADDPDADGDSDVDMRARRAGSAHLSPPRPLSVPVAAAADDPTMVVVRRAELEALQTKVGELQAMLAKMTTV